MAIINVISKSEQSGSLLLRVADEMTRTKNKNFNIKKVSDCFYRGSDPSNNLQALSKCGIKIVLNLKTIGNKEYEKLSSEAQKLGIEYINIPLNPFKIKQSIKGIIEIINKASKDKPLFVHCTFGKDRTGFVTALYRHIKEKMNIRDAIKEMKENGFRSIFFPLKSFLEKADIMLANQFK